MNALPRERQVRVITALVEVSSTRSVERMTNVHRDTIMRLLVRVGNNCDALMADTMRGLECKDLQLDELWTFSHTKQRRLNPEDAHNAGMGDQWVFFALDRDTKLVPAWAVGNLTASTALALMDRLMGSRDGVHPQISANAWEGYPECRVEA